LQAKNIGTTVISVPCLELFWQQDMDYKVGILCNNSVKVVVEAAISQGWDKLMGPHGIFIGMEGFGASAPIEDLYKNFGITAENIVNKVEAKFSK
jgi:transketolase